MGDLGCTGLIFKLWWVSRGYYNGLGILCSMAVHYHPNEPVRPQVLLTQSLGRFPVLGKESTMIQLHDGFPKSWISGNRTEPELPKISEVPHNGLAEMSVGKHTCHLSATIWWERRTTPSSCSNAACPCVHAQIEQTKQFPPQASAPRQEAC